MNSRFDVVKIIDDGLGAEIKGDLSKDIGQTELSQLGELYLEFSWLLFRGQNHLTSEQQQRVGAAFGKVHITDGPYDTSVISNVPDEQNMDMDFATQKVSWHSDGEFCECPLATLVLYAEEVEDGKTSTQWANGYHAYKTMPAELKERCEGRDALHMFASADGEHRVSPEYPRWTSPLLDKHQESGKPFISLSQLFVDSISELSAEESKNLIEDVSAHFYSPSHIITHHWQQGDYVVWDNVLFQHRRGNVSIKNVGPRVLRRNQIGEKTLTEQFRVWQSTHMSLIKKSQLTYEAPHFF